MAGLGTTTMNLAALRGRWRDQMADAAGRSPSGSTKRSARATPLTEVVDFGSNPGHLRMFTFAPAGRPASPALVLVLHGCTQDAAGYDAGAGWSTLAGQHGFVLVFAQQTTSNNQNACFNWFLPTDTTRDKGEALSIRQMVEHAAVEYGADRDRIFVTGLSAGGAMAAAMLAAYPDVFAGGGIVAGLPAGVATNLQQALGAMYGGGGSRGAHELGDLVRAASPVQGRWPRVSIWHGTADTTVKPSNADDLVRQWTDVHGLDAASPRRSSVDGQVREVWCDASGREVVEAFHIAGMAHGTPLQVGDEDGMCGEAGAFLLDVGISSSSHMAAFWGLVGPEPARREAAQQRPAGHEMAAGQERAAGEVPRGRVEILPPERKGAGPEPREPKAQPGGEIGMVITDALRRAGLM